MLLGVDIGGTKIAAGLVSETGELLFYERVPTHAQGGGPAVLARALHLAQSIAAQAQAQGLPSPRAVGIGAGGQINETGEVVSATELLPGWAGTKLAEAFADALGIPACADNDVHALAAGEQKWGAGHGLQNLVYIALGTGVGGAILSSGKLHRSRTGVSGEIGHLILDPSGPLTNSGTRGCLEEYASGQALRRLFVSLGGETGDEEGDDENRPVPFADLIRQNPNGPAAHAVQQTGEMLGIALVSLAHLFGPEKFIIGGGVAGLGDLLLDPARRVLRERALAPVKNTPVVPAALGANASVIGAAALALPLFTDA